MWESPSPKRFSKINDERLSGLLGIGESYIAEEKSDMVAETLEKAEAPTVSLLCYPEIISALCRRLREGDLSLDHYELAKQALEDDLASANYFAISNEVLSLSVQLLERWPLRSADALHIATALIAKADLFVSADKQQCTAAEGIGLAVLYVGRLA